MSYTVPQLKYYSPTGIVSLYLDLYVLSKWKYYILIEISSLDWQLCLTDK